MASFKKGDVVKLNTPVPQGAIQSMRMDDEGNVECLLEWVDDQGEAQQRWFAESALVAAE